MRNARAPTSTRSIGFVPYGFVLVRVRVHVTPCRRIRRGPENRPHGQPHYHAPTFVSPQGFRGRDRPGGSEPSAGPRPTMLPTMISSLSLLSVECVILSVVCTFEPDNGSDVRFAVKVNQVKHYPRPTVFTGWVQATYPTEGYVVHEGLRDRNRRGGVEEVLCAGASAGWSSRVASKQDMAAFTVEWGWWRRRGRRPHLDGKFVLRLPVK